EYCPGSGAAGEGRNAATPSSATPRTILAVKRSCFSMRSPPLQCVFPRAPARHQNAWVPRMIDHGRPQLVTRQGFYALPRGFLLRRANLQDEIAAGREESPRLVHQAVEHGEAARPAVEGHMRLVVADAGRQALHLFVRDVRRVADDEVELLSRGQGGGQVGPHAAGTLP